LGLGIAVRPEIPRTAVAPLPVVAIAFIPVRERPILSRAAFRKAVALTILPVCKSRPIALALAVAFVGRPLGIGLRRGRRHVRLRLKPLLRLLSDLPFRRRGETIRQRAEIAILFHVVDLALSGRPRLPALCERLRGLSRGNKSKVMLGVLKIILRRDRISPGVGVSRELEIFLGDMVRVAAYFHIRSVRFIGSRQRIWASPIVRRPAAHPLVLTWSHFNFPTSIRLSPQLRDHFRRKLFRFWREQA
jgi:hypothetical protein